MAIELVTGRAGSAHVDSEDIGAYNAATHGPGVYILSGCECSLTGTNSVTVSKGELLVEGRHVRVTADTELQIDSGEIGFNRIDAVMLAYGADPETAVESVSLGIAKGEPSAGSATAPAASGSILAGDAEATFPLFTVSLVETSVGNPADAAARIPSYVENLYRTPITGPVGQTVSGGSMDDLDEPGNYLVSGSSAANRPDLLGGEEFVLTVRESQREGELVQTACGLDSGTMASRRRYYDEPAGASTWSSWCQTVTKSDPEWKGLTNVKTLWEGDAWLAGTTTINFSESISGAKWIELLWSFCDTSGDTAETKDYGWITTPVSMKKWKYGDGHSVMLGYSPNNVAFKYFYIYRDKITGHADNTASGTGSSGIAYKNKCYSLRGVYGHF